MEGAILSSHFSHHSYYNPEKQMALLLVVGAIHAIIIVALSLGCCLVTKICPGLLVTLLTLLVMLPQHMWAAMWGGLPPWLWCFHTLVVLLTHTFGCYAQGSSTLG